jgi:hypothetical protein
MREALEIADYLTHQQDEPWPGPDSARLHYWRDKAISAAKRLRAPMTSPTAPTTDDAELIAELRRVARSRLENPDLAIEWKAADRLEAIANRLSQEAVLREALVEARAWVKAASMASKKGPFPAPLALIDRIDSALASTLAEPDEPMLTEEEEAELVERINANPNLHPAEPDAEGTTK